jgi:hypothetical protein
MKLRLAPAAFGLLALGTLASPAHAEQEFPATLRGHAVLPARTFVPAPADAPAELRTPGRFTTGRRVDAPGSVMGRSAGRETGIGVPFKGQPIQGHSGIKVQRDGTFWILTDNGFGSRANSPDSMLYLNRWRVDWKTGKWERLQTVFLSDPDRRVPFRIVHESTQRRYLTGADFDLEGFQFIGDHLWLGDEFGPYLIKADRNGKVLAVFDTMADGKVVRSPDHWEVATPATPTGAYSNVTLRRSKGFEGLAASRDGRFLYPMLEGPLWDAERKDWEKIDGVEAVRILEFDVAAERYTGRFWYYRFEADGQAIGDFNMLDATTALVIERDNGEGTADRACPPGERRSDCFHDLARFKRVYKIEMAEANVGRAVRKVGYIDLMKIADPDRLARKPLNDGVLTFPFFTIENVDRVDDRHIVVGNDNNLPFSSSRHPKQADDNELVLLEVEALLRAR